MPAAGILRVIKGAYSRSYAARQCRKRIVQGRPVQRSKRGSYRLDSDRIDIPTERSEAELVGFADRGARTHERIEHRQPGAMVKPVKLGGQIVFGLKRATQQYPAKDRSKTLGPPLMNVVDRSINLFPPAFFFCQARNELEWKGVRFDEPHTTLRRRPELPHSIQICAWKSGGASGSRSGATPGSGVPFPRLDSAPIS